MADSEFPASADFIEIARMKTPDALIRLSSLLAKLPGVGRRSADRMAMALIRDQGSLLRDLSFAQLIQRFAVDAEGRGRAGFESL